MNNIFTQIFGASRNVVGGAEMVSQGVEQVFENRRTEQAANHATSQANRATERSVEAELNVERLQLVTQAMWEFLREATELTDADLEAKIQEIDLRDGQADGQMARQIAICGHCHRKTGVRTHRRCFYCGTTLEKQHVVEL
ncbi:MAG: hypothetical protein ACSHYB_00965 [Roseibacillus sp.]